MDLGVKSIAAYRVTKEGHATYCTKIPVPSVTGTCRQIEDVASDQHRTRSSSCSEGGKCRHWGARNRDSPSGVIAQHGGEIATWSRHVLWMKRPGKNVVGRLIGVAEDLYSRWGRFHSSPSLSAPPR